MFRIRSYSNLLAGSFAVGIAMFFLINGSSLKIGSLIRMGPGFFPTLIAWILLILGAIFLVKALLYVDAPINFPKIRALSLIVLAPLLFALFITKAGFFITIFVVSLIVRTAMPEGWDADSYILPLALATFCSLVFVVLLGQPITLWP